MVHVWVPRVPRIVHLCMSKLVRTLRLWLKGKEIPFPQLQVAKFEHKGSTWHSVEQCYQAIYHSFVCLMIVSSDTRSVQ